MTDRFYDSDEVKSRARGAWPSLLIRLGVPAPALSGRHGPCPACGGRDRFRFDDQDGRGTWVCGGGGNFQSGDGIGLVMHLRQCPWPEALHLVAEILGIDPQARPAAKPKSPPIMGSVPPAPSPPPSPPKRPPYELAKLRSFADRCPHPVDEAWLERRSPVRIPADQGVATSELFLAALYPSGERVLVFVSEFSQGDFLWSADRGSFRLGDRPGVRAVASPLPSGGPFGVWFLTAPVSGQWEPNLASRNELGEPKMGRRHGACVTTFRYLVLESDEAPADLWLRALVQLPIPIVAAYTSGGRSIHALARVDAPSKAAWDSLRDDLIPILCPLGADPGAMTAVRLSRLPGTLRHGKRGKNGKAVRYDRGKLQRLLYLNPDASVRPILETTS